MAGLVPAIHAFAAGKPKTWMPATRAGMNEPSCNRPHGAACVNPASTIRTARPSALSNGQRDPCNLSDIANGDLAVDALVFEFMGLAMLALCVIVLAVPSGQGASRRSRQS